MSFCEFDFNISTINDEIIDKPKALTITKRCRVCGDQASGFNFNGLYCGSCKAFFRRAAFRDLKCEKGKNCEINQITRNKCKNCRFEKCVEIGMKKELVSCFPKRINPTVRPIDRIRLLSNERTLNLKMVELARLCELYNAVQAFPDESSWQIVGQVDSVQQMVNLSGANIKHIVRFCKNLSEFNLLSKDEQVITLKSLVSKIELIRAAFIYNTEKESWAALDHSECGKRAVLVKMDFFKSYFDKEKCNFFSNFIIDLHQEMENDPAIRDLLVVQLVFKNRSKMDNLEFVRYHNVVFHYLLHRYLEHKYLDKNRAVQKYTKLMGLFAKMDMIANATREFFSKKHTTTPLAPVIKEIYSLRQT